MPFLPQDQRILNALEGAGKTEEWDEIFFRPWIWLVLSGFEVTDLRDGRLAN